MPLSELVADNARISDRAAAELEARFAGLERELEKRLLAYLRRFSTRGGRFNNDKASREILLQVKRVLASIVEQEKLREAVRDLLPEFDRIGENVAFMHGEESGLVIPKAFINEPKLRIIDLTTDNLITSGYDARFVQPVKKALFQHVSVGAEVLETERALRVMIRGAEGRAGLLTQYVGQVARDSLNQYEGQVHEAIAQEFGLTNTRYVGNIIGTTRWQCRRWVKMGIITAEQLPRELSLAFSRGRGMIPGTTVSTWRVNRGGYNCMHSAIPTKREP